MNRRLLVILMSAFAISLVCCYLVYRVVGKRVTTVLPPQRTTAVIAAKTDIKLGSVLRDIDLTTIDIAGSVPKGLILKRSDAIGRGVVSDLYQGEPIAQSRLAAEGSGGGMAATIPQGMRACAVRVDEVVGVAGFVIPGMRVDVLIAGNPLRPQIANDGPVVQTLLQNIQVLSAGTDIQKDAEGKPQHVQVVNLLVTPEQAEILSLASSHTRIQLVLRNPLDMQIGHPPGTALANLFVDEKANRPKHAAGSKDAATPPVTFTWLKSSTARPGLNKNLFLPREESESQRQVFCGFVVCIFIDPSSGAECVRAAGRVLSSAVGAGAPGFRE